MKDFEHPSDDPKHFDKYLQETFRKQAQKRINATKRQLDSKGNGSFVNMQELALRSTMTNMERIGVFDKEGKRINKSEKEAADLFKMYYEIALDRLKTSIPDKEAPIQPIGKCIS